MARHGANRIDSRGRCIRNILLNVLALSGSLRAQSINTALLRTAQQKAPLGIAVTLCTQLGELPLFNPDLEQAVPERVASFRAQVAAVGRRAIISNRTLMERA